MVDTIQEHGSIFRAFTCVSARACYDFRLTPCPSIASQQAFSQHSEMKRTTSSALSKFTFNTDDQAIQHRDQIGVAQYNEIVFQCATSKQQSGSLPSSPMDLTIEDELQATVEILRKTQEENTVHQKRLSHTKDELLGKHRELERSKNCIEIYNQEITCLQQELRVKNEELDEIKVRLQNQSESLANFQHYFAVLKNNRWRLLAALVNTRKMIAMGLERVRQLESNSDDTRHVCTVCRVNEAAATPRVPTPALSRRSASPPCSPPQETVADDDCLSDVSDKLELQSRVTFLENQLIELGEKRQQERLELNDVLQSLEDEVRLLRDDDSRHELVEQRLVESLHLLRSLMDLNISRRTLGNIVVEAVDNSVSPSTQEISPLRFLNHLHRSILEYERSSTEGLIRLALQAV